MKNAAPIRLASLVLGLCLASCATKQAPITISRPVGDLSGKPLEPLAPYLGEWEIEAAWSSGEALSATNSFEAMMGGAFVVSETRVSDNGGPEYHRYTTVFAWDAEQEQIVAHGFTSDGSVSRTPMSVDDSVEPPAITSQWRVGEGHTGVDIRQSIRLIDAGSYSWGVWTSPAALQEWNQIMDGVWERAD